MTRPYCAPGRVVCEVAMWGLLPDQRGRVVRGRGVSPGETCVQGSLEQRPDIAVARKLSDARLRHLDLVVLGHRVLFEDMEAERIHGGFHTKGEPALRKHFPEGRSA